MSIDMQARRDETTAWAVIPNPTRPTPPDDRTPDVLDAWRMVPQCPLCSGAGEIPIGVFGGVETEWVLCGSCEGVGFDDESNGRYFHGQAMVHVALMWDPWEESWVRP